MQKTLVIVESPAKAKTIGRYLGDKYRIAATVGHIRDLPSTIMGVDTKNNFKPTYIPMKGKNKVISELKRLAKDSGEILIATDPDREGEAIAWHVASLLKVDPAKDCRIAFNEITENSVKKAVKEPRPIDIDLVNAQQARRILDRLVGYELSPLLWNKVRKGLSAGRVQSVATRMVVDREQEIKDFKPEEYWNIFAILSKQKQDVKFKASFIGELKNNKTSRIKVENEKQKDDILQKIGDLPFVVYDVRKGKKKRRPYAPYTTSTLQQDAARAIGYSSKKTMRIAQQLYEGVELKELGQTALITYIRTDSVRSSSESVEEIRGIITEKFGEKYIPAKQRFYKNKSKSQDAHEAIRPAHFDIPPEKVEHILNRDQFRLYDLIWNRFMASQMSDALMNTVSVDITVNDYIFRATGEQTVFPGFLILYKDFSEKDPDQDDNEDNKEKTTYLPELKKDEVLERKKLTAEQKFTTPPPRYTEASLIKALEEEGIGRPSTYAPTLSTILDRRYVEKEGKALKPTELGGVVTDILKTGFENIVDLKFTADMEKSLDTVEEGEIEWTGLLNEFYPPFHQQILDASKTIEKVSMDKPLEGEKCPECGGQLFEKVGRYGKFVACENYPKCKYTRDIPVIADAKCPLCGSSLLVKVSPKHKNRKFYVCDKQGKDPECPFISWDLPAEGKECPVCGKYMVKKGYGRRTYLRCSDRDCEYNKRGKTKKQETDE